jgi:hypothetical protein
MGAMLSAMCGLNMIGIPMQIRLGWKDDSHRELSLPYIRSDIGNTARRRMKKFLKVQVILHKSMYQSNLIFSIFLYFCFFLKKLPRQIPYIIGNDLHEWHVGMDQRGSLGDARVHGQSKSICLY